MYKGFIGPETRETLEIYTRSRIEGTRKIPPETDIENHPIFANVYDPEKPLTNTRACTNLYNIIRRAGFKNFSGHGFRKF